MTLWISLQQKPRSIWELGCLSQQDQQRLGGDQITIAGVLHLSLWLHCWSEDICLCIVYCTSPRYLMTIYSIFIEALSRPYCSMIIQERNFWGNSRPLLNCLRWDLTKTPNYNCQSWARLDFKYSGELCVSWNIDELTKIQIEDNHRTGTTQCSIVQLIFLIILFITNIMWSSISF